MEKKPIIKSDDIIQQYRCLFLNEELYKLFVYHVDLQKRESRMVTKWLVQFMIIFVLISLIFKESIRLLIVNITFYIVLIIYGYLMMLINKHVPKVLKEQYLEIKKGNKKRLVFELHKNYRFFLYFWNVLYALIFLLSYGLGLSYLFKYYKVNFYPILAFTIVIVSLLLITRVLHLIHFNMFRNKQRILEEEILKHPKE